MKEPTIKAELVTSVRRLNYVPRVEGNGAVMAGGFKTFVDYEGAFTLKVSVWDADHIAQTWIDMRKPYSMCINDMVETVRQALKDKILEERARESIHSKTTEH